MNSRFATLADNPNSAKTSLFQAMTGVFQHVGDVYQTGPVLGLGV